MVEPGAGAPADHGTIGANDKDSALIGDLSRPSGTTQIPRCGFVRRKSDSRAVINLSAYQDESWPLGDTQHIARAHFDISGRVLPACNVGGYADHQSTCGRLTFQPRQDLILLLSNELERPRLITGAQVGADTGRCRACLDLANQLLATLLLKFP